MNLTFRPSRPPSSFVIASQTLYPCWAALPGSENSPVRGREAPILIGSPLLCPPPPPPEPPSSFEPHPLATPASAIRQRTNVFRSTPTPPPFCLQSFAAKPLQTIAATMEKVVPSGTTCQVRA